MAKFNGFKNWTQWNVSLWVNNDEMIYNAARLYARHYARNMAAQMLLDSLHDIGITETPDGAKYSKTAIKAAMVGM